MNISLKTIKDTEKNKNGRKSETRILKISIKRS